MAYFLYERNVLMCKEKWKSISNYPREGEKEEIKKYKQNSRSCLYFKNNYDHRQSSLYDQGNSYCDDISDQVKNIERLQTNNSSLPSKSNARNVDPIVSSPSSKQYLIFPYPELDLNTLDKPFS